MTTKPRTTSTPRKTTRKPPARKPAATSAAPAAASNVLRLDRPENQAKLDEMLADREPLFCIGDREYTIPRNVPPSWALTTFDLAVSRGENEALAYAVFQMLGEEGYAALKDCPTLTNDDLQVVFKAIMDKVLPEGAAAPKAS